MSLTAAPSSFFLAALLLPNDISLKKPTYALLRQNISRYIKDVIFIISWEQVGMSIHSQKKGGEEKMKDCLLFSVASLCKVCFTLIKKRRRRIFPGLLSTATTLFGAIIRILMPLALRDSLNLTRESRTYLHRRSFNIKINSYRPIARLFPVLKTCNLNAKCEIPPLPQSWERRRNLTDVSLRLGKKKKKWGIGETIDLFTVFTCLSKRVHYTAHSVPTSLRKWRREMSAPFDEIIAACDVWRRRIRHRRGGFSLIFLQRQ